MGDNTHDAERRRKIVLEINGALADLEIAQKRVDDTQAELRRTINHAKSQLGTALAEVRKQKERYERARTKLAKLLPDPAATPSTGFEATTAGYSCASCDWMGMLKFHPLDTDDAGWIERGIEHYNGPCPHCGEATLEMGSARNTRAGDPETVGSWDATNPVCDDDDDHTPKDNGRKRVASHDAQP